MHVLILGTETFPVGLAGIQKMILIGKGLIGAGCRVSVVNRYWCTERSTDGTGVVADGVHEGIEYHFASGSAFRPASWVRRKYLRLTGVPREAAAIFGLVRREGVSAFIVTTGNLGNIILYRMISMVVSVPMIVNLVESDEGLHLDANPVRRMIGRWFDRYVFRFVDGVLPISEYLLAKAGTVAPSIPALKIPVLVDFRRYDALTRSSAVRYLLFCGALGYFEILRFILDSYAALRTSGDVALYLVVNGDGVQFERLRRIIEKHPRRHHIKLFSRLSDRDLSQLYLDAYALLIPLRPTIKDIARFPHKVGEYCASGRPIVSTNIGEIRIYFTNGTDAVIAPTYDVTVYAGVLDDLLAKPQFADEVGRNGKSLARREFDYFEYGGQLRRFIESLGVHGKHHSVNTKG